MTASDVLRKLAADLMEVWGENEFTLDDLSERIIAETAEELAFRTESEVTAINKDDLQRELSIIAEAHGGNCLVHNLPVFNS